MFKKTALLLFIITFIGYLIPQELNMPVKGATNKDYNSASFWYYPWGKSITHKGVDIFAKEGTEINSSTLGLVIYTGEISRGGKIVLVLGPKWRIHYYAHLEEISTSTLSIVNHSSLLGRVGSSGNAKGKSPHLHYSIVTPIPYFWKVDDAVQGWKKMFYLNPIYYIEKSN